MNQAATFYDNLDVLKWGAQLDPPVFPDYHEIRERGADEGILDWLSQYEVVDDSGRTSYHNMEG